MRIARLRQRRAFERLTRDGLHARTGSLWCRYLAEPQEVPPRVAFAVGRSVGPAVARNRLRRRLRAALELLAGSPLLPHGWLLVGARPGALERTFAELYGDLGVMLGMFAEAQVTSCDSEVVQ